MSATGELAAYAVSGCFDDLPEQTVDRTKLAILNILGAAIGGCGTTIGQRHIDLAQATGGGIPEATIIGGGGKLSIPMAVYANASLAFALDYEDVVHYCIHAGPVTVPAALAIGEHRHASGKDFISGDRARLRDRHAHWTLHVAEPRTGGSGLGAAVHAVRAVHRGQPVARA